MRPKDLFSLLRDSKDRNEFIKILRENRGPFCAQWEIEDTKYGKYVRCSNCHYDGGITLTDFRYCPYCGAKMDVCLNI